MADTVDTINQAKGKIDSLTSLTKNILDLHSSKDIINKVRNANAQILRLRDFQQRLREELARLRESNELTQQRVNKLQGDSDVMQELLASTTAIDGLLQPLETMKEQIEGLEMINDEGLKQIIDDLESSLSQGPVQQGDSGFVQQAVADIEGTQEIQSGGRKYKKHKRRRSTRKNKKSARKSTRKHRH